jgi:hypothetical protein
MLELWLKSCGVGPAKRASFSSAANALVATSLLKSADAPKRAVPICEKFVRIMQLCFEKRFSGQVFSTRVPAIPRFPLRSNPKLRQKVVIPPVA